MSKKVWLTGLLAVALLWVPFYSAQAAVIWEGSSLTKVYDPQGNIYAYAPTVIREGDTEHMWTCHNAEDGVFRDHIFYTKRENGVVQESRSVLHSGPSGAWDSFHVCDPAIVAGNFNFEGTDYDYAMFYLGNDVDGVTHNQIGVAFSDDLSGDWVKYPQPVVEYPNDGFWGVGQPSATSVDGQGRLLLFFTKGDPVSTGGYRIEMNLRDMANPSIGPAVALTSEGLKDSNGDPDWFNNFDIVYDPSRDRFVAIRDQHPFPSNNPNYISPAVQLVSIPGYAVWGGGGVWKVEGTLNESITGFPRNHNAGLLRTAHGTLPSPDKVEVYFTDSDEAPDLTGRAEFTYDVWKISGQLTDGDPVVESDFADFGNKRLTVGKMAEDLNTNVIKLSGTTKLRDSNLWIGYRIFDRNGMLVEAGTAYRNAIDAATGTFTIPIAKPRFTDSSKQAKLEVYVLNAKGKTIESVKGNVTF